MKKTENFSFLEPQTVPSPEELRAIQERVIDALEPIIPKRAYYDFNYMEDMGAWVFMINIYNLPGHRIRYEGKLSNAVFKVIFKVCAEYGHKYTIIPSLVSKTNSRRYYLSKVK